MGKKVNKSKRKNGGPELNINQFDYFMTNHQSI